MIDHVVLWLRGLDCQKVRQHPLLKFKLIVEEETGEDKCKSFAELGPMKVLELTPNFIKIHGSLHKLRSWIRHQVSSNHDQFTFSELFGTIHWLTTYLGIPAELFEVKGIEVGLNLQNPPFDVVQACQSLLLHRGKEFTLWQSCKGAVVMHEKYSLKFYDKGRQAGNVKPPASILRVERKATYMEALKPAQIGTLADLLDHRRLQALFDWLVRPFPEILLFDPGLKGASLGKWDSTFCDKARAVGYWRDLPSRQRERKQTKLRAIIQKHCNPSLIQMITEECKKAFEALETGGEFSAAFGPLPEKLGGDFSSEEDTLESETRGEFATSSKGEESHPVCGSNSDARSDSPALQHSFFPAATFRQSQSHYSENNLVGWLQRLFANSTAMQLVRLYQIGTSQLWPGATVFWQVDAANRVRGGKIILFDACTGKRKMESGRWGTWVHSVLKLQGYRLKPCLFGEHLLAQFPDKPVGVVTKEETAMVCTVLKPDFVWLATGDPANISNERFQPLRGRDVTLFPELGTFEEWSAKAAEIKGCKALRVSDCIEKAEPVEALREGNDLGDLLFRLDPERGFALTAAGYPVFWDFEI